MDISLLRQQLSRIADAALSICLAQVSRDNRKIVAGVTVVNIGTQAPFALIIILKEL